jgi:thioredoxin reductase
MFRQHHYDLVVIGSGPAGSSGALAASSFSVNVSR